MYVNRRDRTWLAAGDLFLNSLERHTRTECGYASISNMATMMLTDNMPSFFLSETCKYLYLLFDEDNFVHNRSYIFSTEAHPFDPLQLPKVSRYENEDDDQDANDGADVAKPLGQMLNPLSPLIPVQQLPMLPLKCPTKLWWDSPSGSYDGTFLQRNPLKDPLDPTILQAYHALASENVQEVGKQMKRYRAAIVAQKGQHFADAHYPAMWGSDVPGAGASARTDLYDLSNESGYQLETGAAAADNGKHDKDDESSDSAGKGDNGDGGHAHHHQRRLDSCYPEDAPAKKQTHHHHHPPNGKKQAPSDKQVQEVRLRTSRIE
jgi:hypothetical protein